MGFYLDCIVFGFAGRGVGVSTFLLLEGRDLIG